MEERAGGSAAKTTEVASLAEKQEREISGLKLRAEKAEERADKAEVRHHSLMQKEEI